MRAGGGRETGSTWPGAYVHAGIAWPLRRLGSTYLPTLNLCQPTITGYPSFHPCSPGCSLDSVPLCQNSRGSRDARWICIKCSFVERMGWRKGQSNSTISQRLLFVPENLDTRPRADFLRRTKRCRGRRGNTGEGRSE